ncbi:MAG: hypothetical protein AAB305_00185 [Candidatus Zixiibacteriota bacterium]
MKSRVLAVFLGIFIATQVSAQEHPEHPKKQTTQATTSKATPASAVEATLVGENFCVGCSLKKASGAAAQCETYGHRHALKVSAATVEGKDVAEMKGWVLHYLDTDDAQSYIKEHHGETVTIKGKIYAEARVFEVSKQTEAKKSEHPK